jgi:hypothetical protein
VSKPILNVRHIEVCKQKKTQAIGARVNLASMATLIQ